MPDLTTTVDVKNLPDVQKALRAAADAFAEALGVAPGSREDYSIETGVSAGEARALSDLAEAWTLIAEAVDMAFMDEGRLSAESTAVKWQAKDHIMALQQIISDTSAKRRQWMSARLEKYRPTAGRA